MNGAVPATEIVAIDSLPAFAAFAGRGAARAAGLLPHRGRALLPGAAALRAEQGDPTHRVGPAEGDGARVAAAFFHI